MFHIMVAEDDTNTRKLMCTVLKQNGYEPVPAVDGIDALDILDRQHVDLILLDVMMPRMDGYEFVKTLREGGSTTLSPGTDAGRVCPKDLNDAEPTKHTQPFTRERGFRQGCRNKDTPSFARSKANRVS